MTTILQKGKERASPFDVSCANTVPGMLFNHLTVVILHSYRLELKAGTDKTFM
jgi:hypothetical protein